MIVRLFICEKPSQAVNLNAIIGTTLRKEGFNQSSDSKIAITWCVGHLLEQASPEEYGEQYKSWNVNLLPIIPTSWKMVVKKETSKQFTVIKGLVKKASEIVIATDIDREGETIAWELLKLFGWQGKTSRLWSSSNNDDALRKAVSQIQDASKTYPMYLAGLGRSQADWLVGMNLTRLYTTLAKQNGFMGKVLSVGRVQTPTLNLIVNRDREIKNFIPKPFWTIGLTLSKENTMQPFMANWQPNEHLCDEEGRCVNEQAARQALVQMKNAGHASIVSVETKRAKSHQPLCLSLSELQTQCSRLYGMELQHTLDVAQALYEKHKVTTYPRTDCGYLQTAMISEIPQILAAIKEADPAIIDTVNGIDATLRSRVWNDEKITAHHGIVPTTQKFNINSLSSIERQVYELIRRYYLAQFLPVNEVNKTVVEFECAGETLISRGQQLVVLGWKKLFTKMGSESELEGELDTNQSLPALSQGEKCPIVKGDIIAKQTSAPKPYTDDTLLNAMININRFVDDPKLKKLLKENAGLGTEATRASMIKTLEQRGYIERQKKAIMSTAVGQSLIDALPDIVKNPGMTALWEQALKDIELGQQTLESFMTRQGQFIKIVVENTSQQKIHIAQVEGLKTCPECGKPMVKRKNDYGSFWGCSAYPNCKHMINIKRKKQSNKK
ncbi:DNA topoisomerase III [Orbus sturtevantii]|uniref:DNA topoisomerase III n=1 Tax=Orbus sturtevantii TaxID=3074109 RepID=UPI00370DDFC2